MKAMKYLLIVISLVCTLTAQAEAWGALQDTWSNQPQACMRSTSTMHLSGTTLPQAAVTGTHTTHDVQYTISGPKRIGGGNSGGGYPEPEDPEDPWSTPVGDIPWGMMLVFMVIYLVVSPRPEKKQKYRDVVRIT